MRERGREGARTSKAAWMVGAVEPSPGSGKKGGPSRVAVKAKPRDERWQSAGWSARAAPPSPPQSSAAVSVPSKTFLPPPNCVGGPLPILVVGVAAACICPPCRGQGPTGGGGQQASTGHAVSSNEAKVALLPPGKHGAALHHGCPPPHEPRRPYGPRGLTDNRQHFGAADGFVLLERALHLVGQLLQRGATWQGSGRAGGWGWVVEWRTKAGGD